MDLLGLFRKTFPHLFLLSFLVGGRGHPQGDLGEPHVIVSGSSRGENPGSLRLCSQQPRRAASQDTLMDPCLSGRQASWWELLRRES